MKEEAFRIAGQGMGIFLRKKVHNWALKVARHCTKQTKTPFCTVKLMVQKMTVSPGSGAWTMAVLGQGGGGVHCASSKDTGETQYPTF